MNRVSAWLAAAVSAGAVCLGSAAVSAQITYHAAWSKIETSAWSLTPIYAEENGVPVAVDSFLAIVNPALATGDNLVAVWYSRDGDGWSAKSFDTNDPWEAVKAVKVGLGIGDSEDARWGVTSNGNSGPGAPPKEYDKGILSDDALAALVQSSPDRDTIVELLTSIGYKVADVPVEKEDSCATNEKLDGMAVVSLAFVAGGDDAVLNVSAEETLCNVMAAATPHDTAPAAPWVPQAPVAPSTTPGNPTAWYCSDFDNAGGSVCRCTRTFTYTQPGPPVKTLVVEERCSTTGSCSSATVPAAGCTLRHWY